nr:PREDICTED: putative uncharacterized protein DDB_G0282133 isoform X1 [Megachile rotundata]
MSGEADSAGQICENSLTTLKDEVDPEKLPPRTISHTTRRSRFGTGNVPLSPYILIDGKKLRSSLALSKRKLPRRVSFPTNDNLLVTGYLEPANPWKLAENVNLEDLIVAYKESCIRHNADALETVINQLETLDISKARNEELNLKGQKLDPNHAEALEEIFKRVQFNKVDLEATSLNDESAVILFDMIEYYESAKHLNISSNKDIGIHGWQACANMIRKTQCLEHLEAKDIILNEQYMNILSRALPLVCHLHVLKLENCGLSGRCIITLVAALKMNTGIRELYLADNNLNLYDAIQLGSLLRLNNHIQLLDVSNNIIQDDGVRDMLEGLINQINEDKSGKGLNILVLWNNQLTKKSSPYFARIIALSKTLETLNIGKNMLTDELLFAIKDALKKNRVLLQLGIQATDLTCDGIVTLSEIIEINQILQRIDLRNNNIQLTGMQALSSAMKKNKSITKIDLDDEPNMDIVLTQTLQQYMQFVAEIRSSCSENAQSRTLEENIEGFQSSFHSRFCSTISRKISLTCQTLPCSLSSMIAIQKDESGRSMLEPKRINGGRLRSPIPSPASSPVVSPVPSPSRSRFVVSRVPEASCSTESPVSSSPVVLSSLGSSPTYVTSSASGPSRFRVSVVESANVSLPKPIVTTTDTDLIDLNCKISTDESVDLNDFDNVFISESKTSNDQNAECLEKTSNNVSCLDSNLVKKTDTSLISECSNIEKLNTDQCLDKAAFQTEPDDKVSSSTLEDKEYNDVLSNQNTASIQLGNVMATGNIQDVKNYHDEDTQNAPISVNINKSDKNDKNSNCTVMDDKPVTIDKDNVAEKLTNTSYDESIQLHSQTKHDPYMQKSSSNLGKLLALFQHPSCFFSDSAPINQMKSKNTLQGSISSMMTLGDKFHYYIKDKKDKIYSRETEASLLALKNKSTRFFNLSQIPSLQTLTNMVPSFKFEGNLNDSRQSNESYSKDVDLLLQEDYDNNLTDSKEEYEDNNDDNNDDNNKTEELNVHSKEQEISVPNLNDQLVPENIRSKYSAGITDKNVILTANCIVSNVIDTCYKIVNSRSSKHVSDNKMIVPVPKLIGIPEYSALKAVKSDVKKGNITKTLDKVDSILIEEMSNKTSTNSINFTSDSDSLSCSIMYGVSNDTNTVNKSDRMRSLVILNLDAKDNIENNSTFNVNNTEDNSACFVCDGKHTYYNTLKTNVESNSSNNCLNNEVIGIHSFGSNKDKNVCTDNHNMPSNEVEKLNVFCVNNSTHWRNATVNNTSETKISNINCTCKDTNFDFRNDSNTQLCTLILYKDIRAPIMQRMIQTFITKKTDVNNFIMESTSTVRKANIVMPIPKTYSYITNVNRSVLRDLIHCIKDISISEMSDKENIPSNNWPDNAVKIKTSFYNSAQICYSSTNAITGTSENIHKNDRLIEVEDDISINDNVEKSMHFDKRKFQECDNFKIDSECPSTCIKVDSNVHLKRDVPCLETNDTENNSSENIHTLSNFEPTTTQHLKCTNSNDTNETAHKYFNAIKCAVATTMCSTSTVNTASNKTIKIISDQSTKIAESSSVIHATSTK